MTHLVLVLVLAAAVQSGACPTMCTCGTYPSEASVRCDDRSPHNLTKQLDEATRDLTLTDLDADRLQEVLDDLADDRLQRLARLTVARSTVSANLTLGAPSSLRSLSLVANSIADLPYLNLTGLHSLDLSNNSLGAIADEPFRTLHSLELLNLSANSLTVLQSDTFGGLVALKCLDLSGNDLASLDDAVFGPLQSLQYLNLSRNRLEVLDAECFIPLLRLQQLDVSHNLLVRVELGSLQLPSLARLLLNGNSHLGTSREPVLLVGTGQRLQTVDASQTGLEQVPAALTHSIRTLRLAGNSIRTVRCGDLDSYPLLQLLDFHSNGLELVEDDALGRLDSLSILYLTNNSMKEVPKSLSEKLKVLHLEHNRIERIGRRDLQGLSALEVLLLNDNKIGVIEEEAFNHLSSLVTLDMSRNPIKLLQAGSLSGSMGLQVLRLAGVAVVSPAKEVSFPLSSTEHLVTLDLSGSPGLARQLLVDTAALAASRELQELDLSHTDLDHIRSDLLHFLPQLRTFRIEGNRIDCAQLQWLAAWMRRQDEPDYRKVVCASPPELWGTPLVDLQDAEPSSDPGNDANTEQETRQSSANEAATTAAATTTTMTTTEISRDSFAVSKTPEEHNNETNESFPEVPPEADVINANSSHEQHRWNASATGEMSMFSAGDRKRALLQHPGMLILAAGALGAAAVLTMLAARFTRRRRRTAVRLRQEDLEVSSLPGVTELW